MLLPLKNVEIKDTFWSKYINLIRDVVIPYQWEALNDRIPDADPSYAIRNFRIAAGEESGEFGGMVFQDSDLAKWLEAVGYSLQTHPNPELESLADSVIDLIEKAQQKDGYINTYFTVKEPNQRWTNLWECHELYCAGHMIEAAVAYYEATGKRKFLDVMCRFADYIDSVFGCDEGKLRGYDGHQEIELALVKLYRVTGNTRYLNVSKYFIDERGNQPYFFDIEWEKRGGVSYWQKGISPKPSDSATYNQYHLPVREQDKAVGHAVRAVYMYTAMADIAQEIGDMELLDACKRLWSNIVSKQMYITGGIGSTNIGEAFTFDYDLPNDIVYAETCASIGLIFFAHRMLQIEAKSCYADVLENALYNTVLSAMSEGGKHFFYVNPLEVWADACEKNPTRHHVKAVRQKWFGCACCPPNLARLLSSLGRYIYTVNENEVYVHLYMGGDADIEIDGCKVRLVQETNYPWDGLVKITVSTHKEFTLGLRIPSWCRNAKARINGNEINVENLSVEGYLTIHRAWNEGDTIELEFPMPVEIIQANPNVRANAGKVAIQRGPLVYCLEEVDNGRNLSAIVLPEQSDLVAEFDYDMGAVVIKGKALRTDESCWGQELYRPFESCEKVQDIVAVPYYLWGNRKSGEMTVWVRGIL